MPKPSEVPTLVRFASERGIEKDAVSREGGRSGAGLISGFAVITLGEAMSHNQWVDAIFIESVAEAMRGNGVKSRFTHPGLSGDGMGRQLGRVYDSRVVGNVLRADLHIAKTARKRQDFGGQVLDWAEEDPEIFGASIAFNEDDDAGMAFMDEHREKGRFKSPDPKNTRNLPHVRLKSLRAIDIVDTPATNPSGLFAEGSELPVAAEAALSYAFGLTEAMPSELESAEDVLGIHPERVKLFVTQFLGRHSLEVISKPPQGGARKDEEMEWADVTPATLSEHCPDVVGALRAEGAEEADKKFAADLETAKGEATVEALKVERARSAAVFAKATELRLPADDKIVQKAFAEGLEGDALTIAFQEKALANLQAATPPAVDPDEPPAAPERPSPSCKGLSAEEAWEKNARMPDGKLIRSEFSASGKEAFLEFAANDQEGKKLFG